MNLVGTTPLGPNAIFKPFREALPNLLDKEPGRFVAVSAGKIIDQDSDEFSLVERVAREHPDQQVLIQPIVENGMVDVQMDTPELDTAKGR
jgi:hypothetical protein